MKCKSTKLIQSAGTKMIALFAQNQIFFENISIFYANADIQNNQASVSSVLLIIQ